MDEYITLGIVFLFWCIAMAPLFYGVDDIPTIREKWRAWRKRVREDRDRWIE